MREIKFRVWDLKRNEWAQSPFLEVTTGKRFKDGREVEDHHQYEPDNLILQQFIGLKDKNGKEIYEGDVVVNTHLGSGEVEVVKFEDAGFFAEGLESKKRKPIGADKVEVLGNIYENPELLSKAS